MTSAHACEPELQKDTCLFPDTACVTAQVQIIAARFCSASTFCANDHCILCAKVRPLSVMPSCNFGRSARLTVEHVTDLTTSLYATQIKVQVVYAGSTVVQTVQQENWPVVHEPRMSQLRLDNCSSSVYGKEERVPSHNYC